MRPARPLPPGGQAFERPGRFHVVHGEVSLRAGSTQRNDAHVTAALRAFDQAGSSRSLCQPIRDVPTDRKGLDDEIDCSWMRTLIGACNQA